MEGRSKKNTMKQGRLLLFAIAALSLASCSSTTTLTINAPVNDYETGNTVKHATITAVGNKKVYHVKDVSLPYQMKVKYKHLPLQLNVATDSIAYRPYFIGGEYDKKWAVLSLALGGTLTAESIALFAVGSDAMSYILAALSIPLGGMFLYGGIKGISEKPNIIPADGEIRLEKIDGQTPIEELRIKNEIMGIYALIDKKEYQLARTNAEYFLEKAEMVHDSRHQGELNYLIGVCDYYLEKYKKAIKRFDTALTYDDIRMGFLRDNTMEFRNLAQKAHDAKVNERWAGVGTVLLAGSVAALAASMSTPAPVSSYGNAEYQAWMQYRQSGLPGASTISFEDFKKANARAAAKEYHIGGNTNDTDPVNPVQPHQSTKDCPLCLGSGKCSTCNGKHWYYDGVGLGEKLECPNCKPNGACLSYGGSGKKTTTEYR